MNKIEISPKSWSRSTFGTWKNFEGRFSKLNKSYGQTMISKRKLKIYDKTETKFIVIFIIFRLNLS